MAPTLKFKALAGVVGFQAMATWLLGAPSNTAVNVVWTVNGVAQPKQVLSAAYTFDSLGVNPMDSVSVQVWFSNKYGDGPKSTVQGVAPAAAGPLPGQPGGLGLNFVSAA